MLTVYLAGAMTGLQMAQANGWRKRVSAELERAGITCLSPLRGESWRPTDVIGDLRFASVDKAIVRRDRFDVRRADVILMNLGDAETVSLGSMVEMGWADSWGKPIIVVLDPHRARDPHDHPFLREIATYIVGTLDEAVALILTLAGSQKSKAPVA